MTYHISFSSLPARVPIILCFLANIKEIFGFRKKLDWLRMFTLSARHWTIETCNVANFTQAVTGLSILNSSSVDNGNGPNLVDPGASYNTGGLSADFTWNGNGYFDSNTKTIISNNTELDIVYSSPVQAMGIDLGDFLSHGMNYTLTVFNGANVVGQITGALISNAANPTFNGWENTAGITEVTIVNTFSANGDTWSPMIDNSQYGTAQAVPEPSPFILIGLGIVGLAFKCKSRTN